MSHVLGLSAGQPLTDREITLLQHLASGKDRRAAAVAMGISPLTVKSHLHRIFYKLGAKNSAHAVALAFTAGVLD